MKDIHAMAMGFFLQSQETNFRPCIIIYEVVSDAILMPLDTMGY